MGKQQYHLDICIRFTANTLFLKAHHLNLGPVTTTHDIMNVRAAEFVGGCDALVERARRALSTRPPIWVTAMSLVSINVTKALWVWRW